MKTLQKERKKAFIVQLAKFLVGNQAGKGILLQMESVKPDSPIPKLAKEWAALRNAVPPIFGYPTEEETVEILTKFLQ